MVHVTLQRCEPLMVLHIYDAHRRPWSLRSTFPFLKGSWHSALVSSPAPSSATPEPTATLEPKLSCHEEQTGLVFSFRDGMQTSQASRHLCCYTHSTRSQGCASAHAGEGQMWLASNFSCV